MANLPELNSNDTSVNFITAEIPEFRSTMMDAFSGIQKSLPTTESFTKAFSTMIEKESFGSAIEPFRETVTDLKKTLNNTFQDLRNVLKDLPMDLSEMMKQSVSEAPEQKKENTYEQQIEREDKETFYGELKQIVASPLDYMKSFMKEMQESNEGLLSMFSAKKEKQEGGALERLAEEDKIEREEKTNYYLKEILGVLNKTSSGNNDEEGGGIFSKLMSKFGFKGLGGLIPKLLGGASIVGALGSIGLGALVVGALGKAVFDGFMGWVNAKEWGVKEISGILGGFLGGSAKGGVLNAVLNAGKFALIGFKLGSIFGPIGAFAGLLGGAAIGGILGWFGGEKVAKSIDGVGAWLSEKWNTALEFIKTNWNTYIAEPWDKYIATPLQDLGKKITDVWKNKEKLLREGWETYVIKPIDDYIITPIKTLGSEISKKWDEGIGTMKTLWKKYVMDPLDKNIIQPIRDFSLWWEGLKFVFPSLEPIEEFFSDLKNFFGKFSGINSVYALYEFLTGKNQRVDDLSRKLSENYNKSGSNVPVDDYRWRTEEKNPLDQEEKILATMESLKKFEDYRSDVYNDNGKNAIGYGFNYVPENFDFVPGDMNVHPDQFKGVASTQKITQEQSDKLLEHLVRVFDKELNKDYWFYKHLTKQQQSALVNMRYQLGRGDGSTGIGLAGFQDMIMYLDRAVTAKLNKDVEGYNKNMKLVKEEAVDSNWFKQTTARSQIVSRQLTVDNKGYLTKGDEEGMIGQINIDPKLIQQSYEQNKFRYARGDKPEEKLSNTLKASNRFASWLPNNIDIKKLMLSNARLDGNPKGNASGYIAKNPSVILTGEYGGAGENPEVTIQMNALENRILATTRKLFDQSNQKDMELLTTTYENRLKKAMSNAQQSETRVRQKEMAEQRMIQLQMPVTTSNIDNKTINNVSQPIVMQHSAKNDRNYFRMA
jgi:GH24 family phage-related lysozyme (muramidase)